MQTFKLLSISCKDSLLWWHRGLSFIPYPSGSQSRSSKFPGIVRIPIWNPLFSICSSPRVPGFSSFMCLVNSLLLCQLNDIFLFYPRICINLECHLGYLFQDTIEIAPDLSLSWIRINIYIVMIWYSRTLETDKFRLEFQLFVLLVCELRQVS